MSISSQVLQNCNTEDEYIHVGGLYKLAIDELVDCGIVGINN